MINNNKGFTLVELLATIAIIAILTLIITPAVTGLIKQNKVNACNSLISSIENAASNYVSDNRYSDVGVNCDDPSQSPINVSSGQKFCVLLSTLQDNSYLKGQVKNPLKSNDTTDYSNDKVIVEFDNNSKSFKFKYEGNLNCSV